MTPRAEWHLDTHRLGRRVLVFDCLDSTNTYAAALTHDPGNDGLAILADEQTAGRGRQGRSWTSPPGAGVLLSVLLFPPPALCRPALLTAWAAVAVCETIRRVANVQARIKWPNDVLIRGKKVCGILIDQKAAGGGSSPPTICGIGLNVSQSAVFFAAAELPDAASLALFTKVPLDRDAVAQQLLRQLDDEYARLCAGDLTTLESCWKWRLGLLGRQVVAECATGSRRGRLRDVTWDGVDLEVAPGTTLRMPPEAVLHLSPA